jgi:hypothetical protein
MYEMKQSLLATVAAIGLFAATGMAAAAEGRDHGHNAGMSQGASQTEMNRGADLKGKSETTGAGAADSRSGPTAESNELKHDQAPKAGSKASTEKSKAHTEKAKSSTTGQGTSSPAAKSTENERNAPAAKSGTSDKSAPASKSSMDEKSGAAGSKSATESGAAGSKTSTQTASGGAAGGSVALTSDQKSKIRTSVLQSGSAPKVSRSSINFNVRVGTVVPRSVHFVAVPETLIEIHPAWRGYSYFIVDDEIVIVEPSSFKIVAVLTV